MFKNFMSSIELWESESKKSDKNVIVLQDNYKYGT